MRAIFLLIVGIVLTNPLVAQVDTESNHSSAFLSVVGVVTSPVFPPAILLAKPAEIKNKKNVRKKDFDVSAQVVSANSQSSVGLSLEYNITKDLNYWVAKYSQYDYFTSSAVKVKVQRLALEYRLFPYKKFQMGLGFGGTNRTTESTSITSYDFQFPIKWQWYKNFGLYYVPMYSYLPEERETGFEVSTGLNISLHRFLKLNAGLIYIKGTAGAEDETLTSLDFLLAF
jgi:hypothetical protein